MSASSQEDVIARCAAALADAEARCKPIAPIVDSAPTLSVADAYAIQQRNIDRRTGRGERIVGHKIGLTAKIMQEQFGVHEPDFGHLMDAMVLEPGAPLDLSELIDPQIEIEPAFVLGKPLRGSSLSVDDVLAATDYICAAFEIIDSRIIDWRIRIQDTVADNGSSARVVLGSKRIAPRSVALHDLEAVIELDGDVVARGNTGAVLGNPANGIAWLARKLGEFDVELAAGEIVLPGTCTRACRIAGHRRATGRIAALGEVVLDLENAPSLRRPAAN
jgi:2-keto-4-pentenoate hydratase